MPKSKRSKIVPMTQVRKKNREHKDELFDKIRAAVVEYAHCFVFSVDNMRNNHLKDVRQEMRDSRVFFGKTKLAARALGHDASTAAAPGTEQLTAHLHGNVGLLFTNREPSAIMSYFSSFSPVDFARAGQVAPRGFALPPGLVYSTGGEVPPEHDVTISHTLEPELRQLGVPVRMLKGKVVLGGDEAGEGSEGYVVCKEGDVLDSRQTRLLKMFGVCLAEFRVRVLCYWSAAAETVTGVNPDKMEVEGVEDA